MKPQPENASEITQNSRVPLYILYVAISLTGIFAWRAAATLARIDSRLERFEGHISADWLLADQENWSLRLARENPSLKVPDTEPRKTATRNP
jgi:hypothetical protein